MFDLMPFENNNRKLMQAFNELEKHFFDGFGSLDSNIASCRTDIIDQGDSYRLEAELPGFNKEDIQIAMQGNRLTIRAEHKEEKNDEQKSYIRRERVSSSYARSFDMTGIDTGAITARYENGVLQLNLPKQTKQEPAQRQIPIGE